MELKETLLMPKTEFEMRGNLPNKEPVLVQKWKEENLYEQMLKNREGCKPFAFHDGPPYANGDMHCGHMLNRILKDMIVRQRTMAGYYVPFIFGFDTHGLPIENQVIKSGVNRKTTPTAEFRQKCREYALTQVKRQQDQIIRLGIMGDYENAYKTLENQFEANQIEVFATMALKGLIYKGLKPVYWSWSSESALAEAEIEYKDVKSYAIYVAFDIIDGKDVVITEEDSDWEIYYKATHSGSIIDSRPDPIPIDRTVEKIVQRMQRAEKEKPNTTKSSSVAPKFTIGGI